MLYCRFDTAASAHLGRTLFNFESGGVTEYSPDPNQPSLLLTRLTSRLYLSAGFSGDLDLRSKPPRAPQYLCILSHIDSRLLRTSIATAHFTINILFQHVRIRRRLRPSTLSRDVTVASDGLFLFTSSCIASEGAHKGN